MRYLRLIIFSFLISHFSFFVFSQIPTENLRLWLAADQGVVLTDGKVSSWNDLSGNGFHLAQDNSTNRPSLFQNVIGGKPVLRFNGTNNFMTNPSFSMNQPYTVFIVWSKQGLSGQRILYDGSSSSNRNVLQYNVSQVSFFAGTELGYPKPASFNPIITTGVFNTANSRLLENGLLKVSGNIGAQNLFGITLGARFSLAAFLDADIAEIIFYQGVLTESARVQIETYLADKYAPPINLGADIISCDTIVFIEAPQGYSNYQWSTGSTSYFTVVEESGSYSVSATDIFGRSTSDTILVSFSHIPDISLNLTETAFCAPGTVALFPNDMENLSEYDFSWSNGATTPEITVSETGEYTLTMTDHLGCPSEASAFVYADEFANTATLGEDRPFCLGAELGLIIEDPGAERRAQGTGHGAESMGQRAWGMGHGAEGKNSELLSSDFGLRTSDQEHIHKSSQTSSQIDTNKNLITYNWNTGANTPTITITETGTYWVEAMNENGCLVRDTVSLSFGGYNPEVAFEAEPECPGIPLEFTDLSSVSDGTIVSWFWDFGDGYSSEDQHPLHVPERAPGFADVSLTVTTDAGCVNAVIQPVRVYYEPVVHFTPNNACSGVPVVFTDQSTDPDGFGLTAWSWDFGPLGSSSQQNPAVTFGQAGSATVSLSVTSAKGCSSSVSRVVTIRQSPDIAFEWTTACVGEPVAFADLGVQPPWVTITGREWRFGDGTASTQLNPTHLYPDDGIYPVTLTLTALNGCTISLTQEVTVHSLPEVDFAADDLCARAPHTFTDLSTVENSHLTAWHWTFGAQGAASEQHPVFTFVEAGSYPVSLQATSAAGCTGSLTRLVQVNPTPQAGFSFFPRYGTAPLPITFSNTSAGAASYLWDFGDGSPLSTQASPTHTYAANGIYYPQLIAYTSLGCPDTTRQELKVLPLSVDVAVTHVAYTLQGGFIEVRANILNLGTRDLDTLWLDLHLAGTTPLREQWTGLLRGGDIITYTFRARLPVRDISNHDFLCVTATVPGLPHDDNPDNDRRCLTFESAFRVLEPRPNPAFSEVTIPYILPYEGPVRITLYDLFGNVLDDIQTTTAPAGLNFVTLPVHYLRSGTYYVRVIFREEVGVKKVVKL